MNLRKHLAGFTIFSIILGTAIFINYYLTLPAPTMPPVQVFTPEAVSAEDRIPLTNYVNYQVRLVSLDFINGKSYTTLALKLQPGQPAPEKLLVSTRFYLPDRADNPAWTSTVGVQLHRQPDEDGRIEVTATSECDWCASPDAPRAGYFAAVYVSAQYEGEPLPGPSGVNPVEAAVPVVVQAERKTGR